MPASVGPNMLGDSNLVFSYDTGDLTNSYKGKPTTNLLSLYFNTAYELNGGEFSQYANLAPIFDTYGTGSNVPYSLSLDIKVNIPNMPVLVYMQNGSYTKYGFVSQWINPTSEYKRFTFNNLNANISTPTETQAILAFYTNYGSGVLPSVKNVQVELGVSASPYVSGSRSASASLFDVSGYNRIVNCISGGYDSQAKLSFNGSSNVLDVGSLGTIGDQYSIECVFNSTNIVNYRNVYDMNYSTYNPNTGNVGPRLEQLSTPGIRWIWSGNTTNNALYNGSSIVSISPNMYYHTVFTLNSGIVNTYFNGILRDTNIASAQGYITSFQDVKVGRGFVLDPSRFFSGSIDIFKVYNRVLSVDEVVNNFNELKTRFNFA